MFNSSIKAPVEAIIHSSKSSQRFLEKELKNGFFLFGRKEEAKNVFSFQIFEAPVNLRTIRTTSREDRDRDTRTRVSKKEQKKTSTKNFQME